MPNVAKRIHRIINNYKPKTDIEYEDKKRGVISILNAEKTFVLDFYLNREAISGLTKKYRPQIIDKVLRKYSKNRK